MPTVGATAADVPAAAALVTGGNATHYWEERGIIGKLYETTLDITGVYAWDVWMVYGPGARWDEALPPKPDFTMQQLRARKVDAIIPRLDSKRFAEAVADALKKVTP